MLDRYVNEKVRDLQAEEAQLERLIAKKEKKIKTMEEIEAKAAEEEEKKQKKHLERRASQSSGLA